MKKLIESAIFYVASTFATWTDYEFYMCCEDYDEKNEVFTCVIGFYNSPLYKSFDADIEFGRDHEVDDIMREILLAWERRND